MGTEDKLSTIPDIKDMLKVIGDNKKYVLKVLNGFDHGTFTWSIDMSYMNEIIEIMKK